MVRYEKYDKNTIRVPRQYFPELKKACKMGVSGAKEVRFTTGLPLLQEEKFNRAQTHRWRSGKYYCWDAIFAGGLKYR